jgi:hypothetical protein
MLEQLLILFMIICLMEHRSTVYNKVCLWHPLLLDWKYSTTFCIVSWSFVCFFYVSFCLGRTILCFIVTISGFLIGQHQHYFIIIFVTCFLTPNNNRVLPEYQMVIVFPKEVSHFIWKALARVIRFSIVLGPQPKFIAGSHGHFDLYAWWLFSDMELPCLWFF